jgi:hypothetical protein
MIIGVGNNGWASLSAKFRVACRNGRLPNVIIMTPETFPVATKQLKALIMKYALLVHETPELAEKRKDPTFPAAGRAYGEALQAAGVFIGGAGLESSETATMVSIRNGKRQVHDGPYPETKEFLAGFAIIDAPNLDAALEWAARHPAAAVAAVEVRPLLGSYFAVGTPKSS